jgi:hypothetical protein
MQADRWRSRQGRTLLSLLRYLKDPADRMAWEQIQAASRASASDLRDGLERFRSERLAHPCSVHEWVQGFSELQWMIPVTEEPWKEVWEALLRISISFGNEWDGLLRHLALSQDTDFLERRTESVTLTTLHAAKGLEFPVVFVVGCEERLLPCRLGVERSDPEEERRLLYVGMTRAGRLLYLTRARSRFLYGERRACSVSPFVRDIPGSRIEKIEWVQAAEKKKRKRDLQPTLFKL